MIKKAFFTLLFLCSIAQASNNCMEHSTHLATRYDNKTLHRVACACPCYRYKHANRNRCLNCRHVNLPDRTLAPVSIAFEQERAKSILGL